MEPSRRRRIRKRGIALATIGVVIVLLVALAVIARGLTAATYGEWAVLVGLAAAIQALLWLIPHLGWDERLGWDRHYVLVPTLGAALLFDACAYVVPECRGLILVLWIVTLLFTVGYAGLIDVVVTSAAMTLGYTAAVGLALARGASGSLEFEVTVSVVFLLICVFAGVVFERLRRERREMQALRRSLAALALTDPLTELPNRRQFEESLRGELGRVRRHGGACAVAMIDVDHFKNYNDRRGHLEGDAVLKALACLMRGHLRSGDVGARFGGEEFAVIMTAANRADAVQTVERLRALVAEHAFAGREVQPGGRLTISAGVAACPEDGSDYETLVQKADAALYVAKRRGRNCVVAAPAEPGEAASAG